MATGKLRAMTTRIGRAWVPIVMAIVLAVRAFTVFRFQGGFGSHLSVPDSGTPDLIVQFKAKGAICEVYGPAGRAAAGVLRCWSQLARDVSDRRASKRKVFR
jgi:hypothetical protein